MKVFPLIFGLIMSCSVLTAQHEVKYCGQTEATEKLFNRNPHLREEAEAAREQLEREVGSYEMNRGGDEEIYYIPVVFHIIHNNGPENISDEQVLDAMYILNRDFRLLNEDQEDIVSPFQDIKADIGIEFRLAGLDPDGNCTSGINRVVSTLTYDGDDEMKELIYWPRNKYMNVWVCSDAAGAAGYTNLPANVNSPWAADEDGIVIRYDYLGSIPPSSVGHSRVLTHEVGHWLNLYHTWGGSNNPGQASNCDIDDLVADTPNTVGWSSCNLDGSTCGSDIDNVQNYMEYSYCTRMFTEGQRTRMRAAAVSNVAQRNSLHQTSNLIATGTLAPVLCEAKFTTIRTSVCLTDTVYFLDQSYHGVTEWTWDFGDGTIVSGNDPDIHQHPYHIYTEPGEYNVTLTVGNGEETVSTLIEEYISVIVPGMNSVPFAESFESDWTGDWFVYNQNNDYTWEDATNAAYTGVRSIKIRNFSNDIMDNTDELISATYDMSSLDTVWLSYKWAYANRSDETDDRLRISVTGDCGDTWYLKKVHKGLIDLPTAPNTNVQFVPNGTGQWGGNVLTLDNETWLTDMFRVKFEFVGKGGNNIYLDDINIYGVDSMGVFVSDIQPILGLQVYPNPGSRQINVELSTSISADTRIALYNTIGQVIEIMHDGPLSPGSHHFMIPQHAPGMYTLVINQGGSIQTHKVIFR